MCLFHSNSILKFTEGEKNSETVKSLNIQLEAILVICIYMYILQLD